MSTTLTAPESNDPPAMVCVHCKVPMFVRMADESWAPAHLEDYQIVPEHPLWPYVVVYRGGVNYPKFRCIVCGTESYSTYDVQGEEGWNGPLGLDPADYRRSAPNA